MTLKRRDFLTGAGCVAAAVVAVGEEESTACLVNASHAAASQGERSSQAIDRGERDFNAAYHNEYLNRIAFPLGGIGAGMICLEGTGGLSKFSLRHRPEFNSSPKVFAAVSIKGPRPAALVLEGALPAWRFAPRFPGGEWGELPQDLAGLPRFESARFSARFPFGTVELEDSELPLSVTLTGWSPFVPGDADNASLPVAALEYQFRNRGTEALEAVFSFNARNFLAPKDEDDAFELSEWARVVPTPGGFVLQGPATQKTLHDGGSFAAWVDDPTAKVNHAWFRSASAWPDDALQMAWNDVQVGACYERKPVEGYAPGASVFVPFTLAPRAQCTLRLKLAWYVPQSDYCSQPPSDGKPAQTYRPWYAGRFASLQDVIRYWDSHYELLRQASEQFTRTFYDSTFPPEVLEAASANLSILKSPTVLRQDDGRLWGFEGCNDSAASCPGTCTFVWDFQQTVAHLFPALERTLRETEFGPSLGADGYQAPRAAMPIRPIGDEAQLRFPNGGAADGQLSSIIRVYREWRISGDTTWVRGLWPKVRLSLDYCIKTWDPRERGLIEEPHACGYDAGFWGADSMCTTVYVGALRAAVLIGDALRDDTKRYRMLLQKARRQTEMELFNGEYFFQKIELDHLQSRFASANEAGSPTPLPPEAAALLAREGPNYQYRNGCLTDGVLGAWLTEVCGVGEILDREKVTQHLTAVHRYNFRGPLRKYANLLFSNLGGGQERAVVVCSWPQGGRPSLPIIYCDEVLSGSEYAVASHLIMLGKVEEGLQIVRACRHRYDGRVRNPFGETEAGHWYARSMASYALLQALSGARYDAVERTLYLRPAIPGDFRCFLSTATGFGTVGVKNGQPFLKVVAGHISPRHIHYTAFEH